MIVQALIDQGVDTVFGSPGGAVPYRFMTEVFQQNTIKTRAGAANEGRGACRRRLMRARRGKPGVVLW